MKTNFLNIGYKIESSNKTQEKTTGVEFEHYLFFCSPSRVCLWPRGFYILVFHRTTHTSRASNAATSSTSPRCIRVC